MKKVLAIILVVMFVFGSIGIYADNGKQYTDMIVKGKDHWATPYVDSLTGDGIFDGYPDGSFRPEADIRVDEFIKIVVTGMGYDLENAQGYWAGPYIDQAEWIGLTEDGEFPNTFVNFYSKPITRGEMARIITRAVEKDETISDYAKFSLNLSDYNKIPTDFKEYVLKSFAVGIITGKPDGSFDSEDTATRAEAAAMISRFLNDDQRKIPEEITRYSPDPKLNAFATKYKENVEFRDNGLIINYLYEEKSDRLSGKSFLNFRREDIGIESDMEYLILASDKYWNSNNLNAMKYAIQLVMPDDYEAVYKDAIAMQKKPASEPDWIKTYGNRKVQVCSLKDGIFIIFYKPNGVTTQGPYDLNS